MPIEYDSNPGSANKKQRRRNGQLPDPPKPSAGTPPIETMRVRMLQSVNPRQGNFRAGQVVHLPVPTARSWIGFGLAEEDKMLNGAPETKAEPQGEAPARK